MKRSHFFVLITFLLIFFSNSAFSQLADTPWPMFHHDLKHTGRSQFAGPNIGEIKWTFETDNNIFSSPAIDNNGTIYFGSRDSKFYALNPNGTEKWQFKTNGEIASSPALAFDGTIYFGSNDNNFYALNSNGNFKWSIETGNVIASKPVIGIDGTIYFGN